MFRVIFSYFFTLAFAGLAAAGGVPNFVAQYASAFERSQTKEEHLPPGQTLLNVYTSNFFSGLTHPNGGIYTKSDLMRDAYTQGQAYWSDYPSKRDEAMAEFGYLAVKANGFWSRGMEKSAFKPDKSDEGEWWMTTFGNGPWLALGLSPPDNETHICIVGYLSPKGHYGHLGAYVREILVTAVSGNSSKIK